MNEQEYRDSFSFLVLQTDNPSTDLLQQFSDKVMQWPENIWVFDMRDFLNYWIQAAKFKGNTVLQLWRQLLSDKFSIRSTPQTKTNNLIEISPTYRASYCEHPWRGILIVKQLQKRNQFGLIGSKTSFGNSLLKSLNWDLWFQEVKHVGELWERQEIKGFKKAVFNQQSKKMKEVYKHLNLYELELTKKLKETALIRRFGKFLTLIWQWTFLFIKEQTHILEKFPWIPLSFFEELQRESRLEFTLYKWEQVESYFKTDLNQLSLSFVDELVRVFKIDWEISLDDGSKLKLSISFKHPHSLVADSPDQKTALIQAQAKFLKLKELHMEQSGKNKDEILAIGIIHWNLKISETIRLPKVCYDIFGDQQHLEKEKNWKQLENELPVNLFTPIFHLSWVPELSSQREGIETSESEFETNLTIKKGFQLGSQYRPLFLQNDLTPISPPLESSRNTFLEAAASPWWEHKDLTDYERHFFKYQSEKKDALWVFKNSKGDWFQQGSYG